MDYQYSIQFTHERPAGVKGQRFAARGGVTICRLQRRDRAAVMELNADGSRTGRVFPGLWETLYYAEAICSPKDNYNKRIGRELSAKRAFEKVSSIHARVFGPLVWGRKRKKS